MTKGGIKGSSVANKSARADLPKKAEKASQASRKNTNQDTDRQQSAAQVKERKKKEEEEDVTNGISADFLRMKKGFINDPPLTAEEFKLLTEEEQDDLKNTGRQAFFTLPLTFEEYLETNVLFLQGHLCASHYHAAPVFDQDIDGLIELHREHRIFTHDGQSGHTSIIVPAASFLRQKRLEQTEYHNEQRAYLSILCERKTMDRLHAVMSQGAERKDEAGMGRDYVYAWSEFPQNNPDVPEPPVPPHGGSMPDWYNVTRLRSITTNETVAADTNMHPESQWDEAELFDCLDEGLSQYLQRECFLVDIAAREYGAAGDVIGELLTRLRVE